MSVGRRWSDLSQRNRRLIILGATVEGIVKIAALVDMKRRPASQIRGSKVAWAVAVILVNSFGAVPLSYFAFGRHRETATE